MERLDFAELGAFEEATMDEISTALSFDASHRSGRLKRKRER
jgi:hypothetical protein